MYGSVDNYIVVYGSVDNYIVVYDSVDNYIVVYVLQCRQVLDGGMAM